ERLYRGQIAAGEKAIELHPGDAYAEDVTGIAYTKLARRTMELGRPVEPLLDKASANLEQAIRDNPRFPWAHNDCGSALGAFGETRRKQNKAPRELYQKAILPIKKAPELDDQYALAYNNLSVWLNELAEWNASHGQDPEQVIDESVRMAERAIQINK